MLTRLLCRHWYGLPITTTNRALVRGHLHDWLQAVMLMFSVLVGMIIAHAIACGVFSWNP